MLPLTGSSKIGAKNNLPSSKNPISLFVEVEVEKCSTLRKSTNSLTLLVFYAASPPFTRIGPNGSQKEFRGGIQYSLFYIVHLPSPFFFLPSQMQMGLYSVGGKTEVKANNTSVCGGE